MTTPAAATALRFGRHELQAHERRLLIDGAPAALGARAFDLLLALAERPGRLVSKRTLMELVWPGLVVHDNNLAAQMSALRKVVGDAVIATIPGRGYRFVARIEPVPASGSAAGAAHEPAPAQAAPGAAFTTPPTNLPGELPALLGRADDVAALGALVDGHRLVSVVGPGGIGKSLLVQHLLAARRAAYAQGVCWVELAALADAAALPGAIAAALGLHGGPGDPQAQLIAAVAPLTMLLALDNAEHLLDDVARLCQALHAAAPGLRIVVTSQAPLKLPAERVLRIEPLAVPPHALPAAQALQFGAVALLAERARAVDARFEVTDANVASAIALCRALDGLPLAIELAAARAPLLGLAQLLASMPERLRLLSANRNRTAPERQRTLRAALEWSHGLLPPREQQAFRRLGVIAGSASLGFIRQLLADADDDTFDAWAVLDALDVLVDRSLVAVLASGDAHDADGAPRYRLLESQRAYALERLHEAGESAAMQRRHALAMAARFDDAYERYFSGDIGADAWEQQLAPDLDNARDAWAWAHAAGEAGVALTIGATLLRALPSSLHRERVALAERCEALVTTADAPLSASLQQRVWLELNRAWADTQKPRARAAADRSLALARQLDRADGDRFVLYHALCRSASAAAQAGDVAAALAPLAELQALEDPAWPAQRRLWGADAAQTVARMRGDAGDALRLSRSLLLLDRARGSDDSIALGNLIDHELAAGDAAAAVRSGTALVAALQGTRHELSLAFARINLCAACLAVGDTAQARAVALAMWPHAVLFELQQSAATYLALLAALEQRPHAAARLLGYAEATYAARADPRESNETAAATRVQALARPALGDAALERLLAEGAALGDGDVAALAFGGAE
ncbi:MAG TPA: winged helix-turn-helix domain-containing protein [Burkholderiaceae bacterium]|nr:winged helix-turn-helix domain-containing protein [Burkholderiaceae bacterium]